MVFQVNEANRPMITSNSGGSSQVGVAAWAEPSTSHHYIGHADSPTGGYVPQGRPAAAMSDMTDSASQGIAGTDGHDSRHS